MILSPSYLTDRQQADMAARRREVNSRVISAPSLTPLQQQALERDRRIFYQVTRRAGCP